MVSGKIRSLSLSSGHGKSGTCQRNRCNSTQNDSTYAKVSGLCRAGRRGRSTAARTAGATGTTGTTGAATVSAGVIAVCFAVCIISTICIVRCGAGAGGCNRRIVFRCSRQFPRNYICTVRSDSCICVYDCLLFSLFGP
jgi:hypothetical protein